MDVISYALSKKFAKKYTDAQIAAIAKGMNYIGSVATFNDLPLENNNKGDVYTVSDYHTEYVWSIDEKSGTADNWEELGGADLSNYYNKQEIDDLIEENKVEKVTLLYDGNNISLNGVIQTFNDIKNLVSDDKKIVEVKSIVMNIVLRFVAFENDAIWFGSFYKISDEWWIDRLIINSDNVILFDDDSLEMIKHKVTSISKTSTDTQYPSARATYDAIKNASINYSTEVPTSDNLDGLKIVVLNSEPETKYEGYIYIIKEV